MEQVETRKDMGALIPSEEKEMGCVNGSEEWFSDPGS